MVRDLVSRPRSHLGPSLIPTQKMDQLDDEPSLQEALQLIDDWDTDLTTLLSLEGDTVCSPPPPPPTMTTLTKKRRRGKPSAKVERLELLQAVEQLQANLAGYALGSDDVPLAGVVCDEWGAIAARQREVRLAAEVENEQLRSVLRTQLKATRKAASLLAKVKMITTVLGSDHTPCVDDYRGPRIDPEHHLAKLDELASEAPVVFASDGFASHAKQDFRDVQFRHVRKDSFLIEVRVSWVLPFSVPHVVDALWYQTTRMPREERVNAFQDTYETEDTLVSHFVSEAKRLGTIHGNSFQPLAGSTHGQIATQRVALSCDGTTLIVSRMDVKNLAEDSQCRSVMTGDGFLLVEPVADHAAQPLCRVKWCRRITSSPADSSQSTTSAFSRWVHGYTTRAMREKWWNSIDYNLQAVENMLLTASQYPSTISRGVQTAV